MYIAKKCMKNECKGIKKNLLIQLMNASSMCEVEARMKQIGWMPTYIFLLRRKSGSDRPGII